MFLTATDRKQRPSLCPLLTRQQSGGPSAPPRLTDLIQLSLGTFAMSGFAET